MTRQRYKYCCSEDERSSSTPLPNSRPVQKHSSEDPCIEKPVNHSHDSSFNSAQTEDIQELRSIFNTGAPSNPEYSMESSIMNAFTKSEILHKSSKDRLSKAESIKNVLRRKLSRGISRSMSSLLRNPKSHQAADFSDIHAAKLKTHREQIKKDLFSTKAPEDGGYDEDAEEFGDILRRISHPPIARASLRSIEWRWNTIPALPGQNSAIVEFSRNESSPNNNNKTEENIQPATLSDSCMQRRASLSQPSRQSESELSFTLPLAPVLRPTRLPSLSESETRRLCNSLTLEGESPMWYGCKRKSAGTNNIHLTSRSEPLIRSVFGPDVNSAVNSGVVDEFEQKIDSCGASVHLYSMRISQHLRSTSTLSTMRTVPSPDFKEHRRTCSDGQQSIHIPKKRRECQGSSSGFASSKVPSTWGNVVCSQPSSIYSSRPESPNDGYGQYLVDGTTSIPITSVGQGNLISLDGVANEPLPHPERKDSSQAPETFASGALDSTMSDLKGTNGSRASPSIITNGVSHNEANTEAKTSKFREEFSGQSRKNTGTIARQTFHFLRQKLRRSSTNYGFSLDTSLDGAKEIKRTSRSMSMLPQENESKEGQTSDVWEKALQAHQSERSALFLSPDKAAAKNLFRERSSSINRAREHSLQLDPLNEDSLPPPRRDLHSSSESSAKQDSPQSSNAVGKRPKLTHVMTAESSAPSPSAWVRYPSHTRAIRTGSAGKKDSVATHDFAATDSPERLQRSSSTSKSDHSSTMERPKSRRLEWLKKSDRKGTGRLAESHSMASGKRFLKDYAEIFRSQSMEYFRWGYGHRSSIAVGRSLKHPELEVLPPVWAPTTASASKSKTDIKDGEAKEMELRRASTKSPEESDRRSATLSPVLSTTDNMSDTGQSRKHVLSNSDPGDTRPTSPERDGIQKPRMGARYWSEVYQSCIEPVFDDNDSGEDLTGDGESVALRPISENNCHNQTDDPGPSSDPASDQAPFNRQSIISIGSLGSFRSSAINLFKAVQESENMEREHTTQLASGD